MLDLHFLRDVSELEERKHDGEDDGTDDGSDEYDDERFERRHDVGDESAQLARVVFSNLENRFSYRTGFFAYGNHMHEIEREKRIFEFHLLFIIGNVESHRRRYADSGLDFVLDADDVFLVMDVRNDVRRSLERLEHEDSGIQKEDE